VHINSCIIQYLMYLRYFGTLILIFFFMPSGMEGSCPSTQSPYSFDLEVLVITS